MTVSSTTNKISYACTGAIVDFPYTFKVFDEDDLTVVLRDSSGTETTLTITTHYSVSGVGNDSGGNVTTVATYALGYTLVIKREMDLTQETDYVDGSAFSASSHENALDKLTMISQQFDEEIARSLLLPVSSAYSDLRIPDPQALKYLRWNNAASAIENAELVAFGDLTAHNSATDPHQVGWYANNSATGPVILATAAEVAAGSNASKVITPSTLLSVIGYETFLVPASAFIEGTTNGATLSSQEYLTSKETHKLDYAEFGQNNASEVVFFRLCLPGQWDMTTLKAKPVWMASYNKALSNGASVAWGFQARAINDGSRVDTNYGTPPAYSIDTVINESTATEHRGPATANFATAIPGADQVIDFQVSRRNAGTANNATACVWLTGVLMQIKRLTQGVSW